MKDIIATLRLAVEEGAIDEVYLSLLRDQLAALPVIPPPASPLSWRVVPYPHAQNGGTAIHDAKGNVVAESVWHADAAFIVAVANAHAAAGKESPPDRTPQVCEKCGGRGQPRRARKEARDGQRK